VHKSHEIVATAELISSVPSYDLLHLFAYRRDGIAGSNHYSNYDKAIR